MSSSIRPWRMMMLTVWVALMHVSLGPNAKAEEITNLPGQPTVSFKQFSGYITVDQKQDRALFYYFVEAESDPSSKPLVLWLNGGPGCSSVGVGAFIEHGPFRPSGDVLVKNEYSWNKEANMLYLESPAGVGFSYSANRSYYNSVGDEMTARDSLVFLQQWLGRFPQYNNREFFITGESYAGHYVPQLAQLIAQSNDTLNLKGIAIGNPLLDFNTDFNSRAVYFWSHGLISDLAYDAFTELCNYSQIRRQSQQGSFTPLCSKVLNLASQEISKYVDGYNVISDVCSPSSSSFLSQSFRLVHTEGVGKIDVCIEQETGKYLNRKDVQNALHAQLVGVSRWTECSSVLKYQMQDLEVPTTGVLGILVKHGIRVFVYSGDQDSAIPLIGTRKLVNLLAEKLGLNTTVPYRVWFEGGQVGGWTQAYGDLLSYATIRGASHEAPFSQPERSLLLFKSFLQGRPLPDLPV